MELLLTLLPFSVIASFTPGPNNILVMSQGINSGFRSTVAYQLGAGVACFVIIGGVMLLGAQVEKALPAVINGMKYVGCAYMLWLAWVVATASPPQAEISGQRQGAGWRAGFALQFVNPKFYLYTLTLAAVLLPSTQGGLDISLYAFFFAAVGVAGMFTWALAGALLQGFLSRWHTAANACMGLALVWCAWSLL